MRRKGRRYPDAKKHIDPTPAPHNTDLVPEFVEHDRVQTDNEEEGKQVTGHKEADLKHEIGG
jgi:hypothetical protein